MSNGDFEVMPVGTMQELKALRDFANSMSTLNKNLGSTVPPVMSARIEELSRFYAAQVEKYLV